MAANPNGENVWERYKNATCLIETSIKQGTGFFFGGGWVMSVAHNFQNDNTDSAQLHNLLSQARFRFTVRGQSFDFPPHDQPPQSPIRRMAFIHHLQPGENVDPNNMDIAMVKLGKQYEYGRSIDDYEEWEKVEQGQLDEMNLGAVFAPIGDRPAVRDNVHAIHYAGEVPNVMTTGLTVTETLNVINLAGNPDRIPIMRLRPALNPTASGCPIINGNFKLVGLLVGCGKDMNHRPCSMALMWNRDIREHIITREVPIFAEIGRYMALINEAINQQQQQQQAENARQHLEEMARDGRLTIYLMNGEVISGLQANNN